MNENAAEAFIKAGNFKAAQRLAHDALAENPRDGIALGILCDVYFKQRKWRETEEATLNLLAVVPDDLNGHANLLHCYIQRKDKKMAERLLEHFREVAPYARTSHELLQAAFDIGFGDKAKGFAAFGAFSKSHDDRASEFKFNSLAAMTKGDLSEAFLEGELAFRAGDETGQHAAYLSMLAYRMFKFKKCRTYARAALAKDATLPIPRELLVLSWLVLFPPFLLALAFLWVSHKEEHSRWISGLSYFFGIPVLLISFIVISYFLSPLGLTIPKTVMLAVAFGFYQPYIGAIAKLFKRRAERPVNLKGY